MAETGLYEFTTEFQPGQKYVLSVGVVETDGWVNLRYTASNDPESEPAPVSLSSNLFSRSFRGGLSRAIEVPTYAHFRFLLTSDVAPPPDFQVMVMGDDGTVFLNKLI